MKNRYVDLRAQGAPLIRRVYHQLLVPAFPADELDPEETFVEDVAEGAALTLAFVDGAGTPTALIAAYPYADVLLIGYLVTRQNLRSNGLGSQLLHLGVHAGAKTATTHLLSLRSRTRRLRTTSMPSGVWRSTGATEGASLTARISSPASARVSTGSTACFPSLSGDPRPR